MATYDTQPTKKEADGLSKISICYLNQQGLLTQGFHSTTLSWGRKHSKTTSSIRLHVALWRDEHQSIALQYSGKYQGKKKDFEYDIELVTTACNYGGARYWFVCPVTQCKRRVGVLYIGKETFACRHCHNLTYKSRKEDRHHSMRWIVEQYQLSKKIDGLESQIKRQFYAGRPTKKQRRLNELYSRLFDVSLV